MLRDCVAPYMARSLALMGLLALTTGCRHSPFQRLFDAQAIVESRPAWRMDAARPHLHPHPAYMTEATPKEDVAHSVVRQDQHPRALISSSSTPLLDAALKRAEAEETRMASIRESKPEVIVRSQDGSIGKSRQRDAPAGISLTAVPSAKPVTGGTVVVPLQLDPPPPASVAQAEESTADSTTPDQVQPKTPLHDPGVTLASASVVESSTGEQVSVKPPGGDEALACTEGCTAPNASQPQSEPASELSLDPLTELLQPSSPAAVEASGPPKETVPPPPDLAAASISSPPLLVSTPEPPKETPPALSIAELHLCREIRGFGKFQAVEHQGLKAGQPIFVYCELPELQYQEAAGGFVTRLSSKLEIVGEGDAVVWSQSLGEAEDHCQSRRRDNFANSRITIPAQLAPGGYRLKLSQTDLVAGQTATAELPFTIAP